LGKYGYRQITSLSAAKRRDALAKAASDEGYLPIYRKIVLLRTFNKNREHLFKLYDSDVKWMKKNRDSLEHGWYPKPTKRRTKRRSTVSKSRNIKKVSVPRRKTSSLIIKTKGRKTKGRKTKGRKTSQKGGENESLFKRIQTRLKKRESSYCQDEYDDKCALADLKKLGLTDNNSWGVISHCRNKDEAGTEKFQECVSRKMQDVKTTTKAGLF
jgi:hypothetical protein